MAWGLEARVPFLDKSFLEVAMNVNPEEKMFNKGAEQEFDEDGCPKMEKVCATILTCCTLGVGSRPCDCTVHHPKSVRLRARWQGQ